MTDSSRNTPPYPKSHLLAASGIAALLSLTLLIFPSSQVEAKKTLLPLDIEAEHSSVLVDKDEAALDLVTPNTQSPRQEEEQVVAAQPEAQREAHITVAKGDTLSSVLTKAA